jgi:hypothetical protein
MLTPGISITGTAGCRVECGLAMVAVYLPHQ